jgi:hypothetical protein
MDLTYATILVFGGEYRRLYREAQLAYIISDEANPTNHPILSLDTNLGSSLQQLTNAPEPLLKLRKHPTTSHEFSPPSPLSGKCFLMEPLPGKALVPEYFLCHLLREPYLNGITLEDAPESTKQLWRFLLKTSKVKRKGGTKGFPFLSSEQAFTVGLFMGVIFSPWLVLVVVFSIDFNSCKRKSFY